MRVTFEEVNDDVVYRIADFDPKYERVLQMCYFADDGQGYVKRYPKNTKYIEKMQRRFRAKAQQMFDQAGYFAEIPWGEALASFCKTMGSEKPDWWLAGSCAMAIRGIPVDPHDIDIMIDSGDVAEVTEIFSDYLIEPIVDTGGWVTKDFGVVFLHARIDIASDPAAILDEPDPVDCGPYAKANLEVVDWEGFKIKVPPVELHLNANKKRGRLDRVAMIERYLSKAR